MGDGNTTNIIAKLRAVGPTLLLPAGKIRHRMVSGRGKESLGNAGGFNSNRPFHPTTQSVQCIVKVNDVNWVGGLSGFRHLNKKNRAFSVSR